MMRMGVVRYEHQAAHAHRNIDAFLENLEPDSSGEPLCSPAYDKAMVAIETDGNGRDRAVRTRCF